MAPELFHREKAIPRPWPKAFSRGTGVVVDTSRSRKNTISGKQKYLTRKTVKRCRTNQQATRYWLIHQADKNSLTRNPDKNSPLIHQADRISPDGKTDKRSPLIPQTGIILFSLAGKTERRSQLNHQADRFFWTKETDKIS